MGIEMPKTSRDVYDNKSQLLHQVGTSHHLIEELAGNLCFN
jgi:hypothetical protein